MKKVLLIIVIIGIIIFGSVCYIVISSNSYERSIIKEINSKYDKINIAYLNVNDYYYIVRTNQYVIVLDENYNEVTKVNCNFLQKMDGEYNIVYKKDELMYEVFSKHSDYLIYKYYRCSDLEYVYGVKIRRN